MKLTKAILLLVGFCSLPAIAADEQAAIIGDAHNLKTEELLYREYHYFSIADQTHKVVYKDSDNNVIAEKSLDYQPEPIAPSLSQVNKLCGEALEVKHVNDNEDLAIEYKPERGESVKDKVIDKPETLVIDAGFNFFVRRHWQAMLNGEEVEFEYLVPSRLRSYRFKLATVSCPEQGQHTCFEIAPDVWYLKFVVDPILLTYDNAEQKLLGFTGLGNIADQNCNYQEVDIRYRYNSNADRL